MSRLDLTLLLYEAERWDDARQLCEEGVEDFPQNPVFLAVLGGLAARRGDREEALRISEALRSTGRPHLKRARIAALLGHRDEAMTLLQRAIEEGIYHGFGFTLHNDIDFESLRDYPPFQQLMRPRG